MRAGTPSFGGVRTPPSIEAGSSRSRRRGGFRFGGVRTPPSIEAAARASTPAAPPYSAACARRPPLKPFGEPDRPGGGGIRRRAHAAECHRHQADPAPRRASMEGGVRTPPNRAAPPASRPSPRLQWRAACARRRIGSRLAAWTVKSLLQWRAACARRRMRASRPASEPPSGFNGGRRAHAAESHLRRPVGRREDASMEGGVRTPPNRSVSIGGLTREYALRCERSPNLVPLDAVFSRIWHSKPQVGACFEGLSRD